MKLEEGMYVRSKINGRIGKVVKIEELVNEKGVLYYELDKVNSGIGFCSTESVGVIASHDIIDLIEVGDYVNGNRIDQIDKFKDGSVYLQFGDAGQYYCKNYNIKSIVTKEQFENISYEVN